MKKYFFYSASLLVLLGGSLTACSKHDRAASEQEQAGRIESVTDRIAHDAVEDIQRPIGKARALQGAAEARLDSLEEAQDE